MTVNNVCKMLLKSLVRKKLALLIKVEHYFISSSKSERHKNYVKDKKFSRNTSIYNKRAD